MIRKKATSDYKLASLSKHCFPSPSHPSLIETASHKKGTLELLRLDSSATRADVARALKNWTALSFERASIDRGVCATALRSFDESYETLYPDGGPDISSVLPVTITKIDDAPKRPVQEGARFSHALEGVKVVDMTRVLAGPICGRTLAGPF